MFRAIVVTMSDSSFYEDAVDETTQVVKGLLVDEGFQVVEEILLPDEFEKIATCLRDIADEDRADLVLTTGGTGFSPRDVTPEATESILEKKTPGIVQAMMAASLAVTPRAMLSRMSAGIRKSCLIVNLPGSPKAARENLEAILPALPHGLDTLKGGGAHGPRGKR